VPPGELDELPSLRERARCPGGILEVGDHVKELRHGRQRALERRDVRPVGFEGDADDPGAVAAEQRDRAVVGWRFGEHHVARLQQVNAEKLDQLKRAVAGQHLFGLHALPFGEPLAKRLKAERRSVLEHRGAVRTERGRRRLDDFVDRE
jgi:hypothetical protein